MKQVNADVEDTYVSHLDFSRSGFDGATIEAALTAPQGALMVDGALLPVVGGDGMRALMVMNAFRGMPGIAPAPGDGFYVAQDRTPPIECIRAPCDNYTARALNTERTGYFASISVERAAAPYVDQAWLVDRVIHHGAVVTAHLGSGEEETKGMRGDELYVSQVFVRLSDRNSACIIPLIFHVCAPAYRATYTRIADRCVVFDKCAELDRCMHTMKPACAEGYTLASWTADNAACTAFACDPSFLSQ